MHNVVQLPHAQSFGVPVPDLELPLISGGSRSIQSFLEGKRGGVVAIWSGICSHCIRYDQYFNGFTARHPELALVVIAAREDETAEQVRQTVAERKLTFPILHSADTSAAAALFAEQTPRVYLLDAARVLHYRGAIDNYRYPEDPAHEAYLEPAIADLLAGRPVARREKPSFGCAVRTVYYRIPRKMA